MVAFTATVTDTIGAQTVANRSVSVSGAAAPQKVRSRLYRRSRGYMQPAVQAVTNDNGAYELGINIKFDVPGRILGVSFWRGSTNTGPHSVSVWDSAGSEIVTESLTGGEETQLGWIDHILAAPITVAADTRYTVSYFVPAGCYAFDNGQMTAGWFANPVVAYASTSTEGNGVFRVGSHGYPNQKSSAGAAYSTDVLFEHDIGVPEPTNTYWARFTNGFPSADTFFPVGVWLADWPFFAAYQASGINTIVGQFTWPEVNAIAAIKATGLYLIAGGVVGDLAGPRLLLEDPALAALVKGYILGDEFDMSTSPHRIPSDVQGYAVNIHRVDTTRPIYSNNGKPMAQAPTDFYSFGNPLLDGREYFRLVDVGSLDYYGLTDPFDGYPGLYTYPLTIENTRRHLNWEKPAWAFVDTAAAFPQSDRTPTAAEIRAATWLQFIHGARGVIYFDHRFAAPTDFSYYLNQPALLAAMTAQNAEITALAKPLNGVHLPGLVTVATSNTTSGPVAGVYGTPIDFTVREAAGKRYIFAAASRPGATTATFTVPDLPGRTVTVIGEARTLSTDGSGVFADGFGADYVVHLYSIDL